MKRMNEQESARLVEVQAQVAGYGILEMLDVEPPRYDEATQRWIFPSLPKMRGVIKM